GPAMSCSCFCSFSDAWLFMATITTASCVGLYLGDPFRVCPAAHPALRTLFVATQQHFGMKRHTSEIWQQYRHRTVTRWNDGVELHACWYKSAGAPVGRPH